MLGPPQLLALNRMVLQMVMRLAVFELDRLLQRTIGGHQGRRAPGAGRGRGDEVPRGAIQMRSLSLKLLGMSTVVRAFRKVLSSSSQCVRTDRLSSGGRGKIGDK